VVRSATGARYSTGYLHVPEVAGRSCWGHQRRVGWWHLRGHGRHCLGCLPSASCATRQLPIRLRRWPGPRRQGWSSPELCTSMTSTGC
jgi:hypothetical protein